MGRSILIGLAAFSTTILLIVTHSGATLVYVSASGYTDAATPTGPTGPSVSRE